MARSFPPVGAPEDEESENLRGDESDDEASVGGNVKDGENITETFAVQSAHDVDASSDAESSPAADHNGRADDLVILDATPSTDTSAPQKRSFGGFVDEESLFDE